MVPHVLGVGYAYNEYEVTAGRWKEFEIEFDYADNIKQAAAMLSFKEYICVAICSDVIPQDDLDILRQKRAVPIIVVPPSYSEEQRYACVHFGAAQYLHTYNHPMAGFQSSQRDAGRLEVRHDMVLHVEAVAGPGGWLHRSTDDFQPVEHIITEQHVWA